MLMKSHLIERFGTSGRNNCHASVRPAHSTQRLRYPRIAAIFVAIDLKQTFLLEVPEWLEKLFRSDQQR
jgi:hypothetical protein